MNDELLTADSVAACLGGVRQQTDHYRLLFGGHEYRLGKNHVSQRWSLSGECGAVQLAGDTVGCLVDALWELAHQQGREDAKRIIREAIGITSED